MFAGYLISSNVIIKQIGDETFSNAKELLSITGMSRTIYWISHFVPNFAILSIHNMLSTVIFYHKWNENILYSYTNYFIFFIGLTLLCIHVILLSMLSATLLSTTYAIILN